MLSNKVKYSKMVADLLFWSTVGIMF